MSHDRDEDNHKHRVIRMIAHLDEQGEAVGDIQVDQLDLECTGLADAITELLGGEPEAIVPYFVYGTEYTIMHRGAVRLNVYADSGEPTDGEGTAAEWIARANETIVGHPENVNKTQYVLAQASAN